MFLSRDGCGFAQVPKVEPRIVAETDLDGKITVVDVAARYVTAIRLPEAVNSVVVGDPSAFQVEHSEREPRLVFVKALSTKPSETNLLISTAGGHEVSLLLISRGESNSPDRTHVDFLLKYEASRGFFVRALRIPFRIGRSDGLVDRRPRDRGSRNQKALETQRRGELTFSAVGDSLTAGHDSSTEDVSKSRP